MCDRTRAVPGGRAATDECGLIAPSSPGEAVSMYRIDGTCSNERGSSAHRRTGTAHTKDSWPPSFVFPEASIDRDVVGPMPEFARLPNMRGFPSYLAITEWGRRLRDDYVPSRKRYKPSVMDSGAATVQRKGDSFPFLIPGNSSQEEAIRLARDINPCERLLASALSPAEQACVSYICMNPFRVKLLRRRVIKHIESLSESLRSSQIQLSNSLPELAAARKLRIPLICNLVRQLDYADESLSADLVRGAPIVGVVPRTSTLPANVTPSAMNLLDVRGEVRTTNTNVLKSLSKSTVLLLKQNAGTCHTRNFGREAFRTNPCDKGGSG